MKKFITFIWMSAVMLIAVGMLPLEKNNVGENKSCVISQVKADTAKPIENPTQKSNLQLRTPVITVKNKIEKQVTIEWTRTQKANSYNVYRAQKRDGKYQLIATTTKRSYTDSDTIADQQYFYKVQAVRTVEGSNSTSKLSKAKYVKAKKRKVRMVIAGECYVEGIELWSKDKYPKGTKFVSYVGVSTYRFLNVKKFKVNGKSVTGIDKVISYTPDRVYFLLGMNESGTDNTTPTINNFKTMIKKLKKANKEIQIVILPIAPTGKHSTANVPKKSQRLKFNQAYADLAASTENVYYYDYTGIFDNGKGYLKASCDGGDGCHWTSSATIAFSENLMQWSRDNLY